MQSGILKIALRKKKLCFYKSPGLIGCILAMEITNISTAGLRQNGMSIKFLQFKMITMKLSLVINLVLILLCSFLKILWGPRLQSLLVTSMV